MLIFGLIAAVGRAALASQNEGFAVGALTDGGVLLVSTHADLFQGAIALTGVICTLCNAASDTKIGFLFHFKYRTFQTLAVHY